MRKPTKAKLDSEVQLANIKFHRLLAESYERQPFFSRENRIRLRCLLESFARDTGADRLLDLGCGTGLVLDLAFDLFKELDGIDITEEMLARVKPRPNIRTQKASAENIPFPNDTFDVVTAYSVLHHLEDLGQVFREVRRTLRPGGIFYADESPSQHFLDGLLNLDPESVMTDLVRQQRERVADDFNEYGRRFGLSAEVVKRAMVQNYSKHSLTQETLESLLKSAGFDSVAITFRRFVGGDEWRREHGEEQARTIHDYLSSMLPLTRHLFKYFVLVAR
jgi:ubiquinone/menaquinone biosynthesis C-methylase UbiE